MTGAHGVRVRSTAVASTRRRLATLGRVCLPACVVVLSSVVGLAPAAAVEDNPDIDTAAAYEYRVDPSTNSVNVTITLEITADKPNRNTADGYYQYYFTGYGIAVPKAAQDITIADSSGVELGYEIEHEDEWVQAIVFGFRRNIYYRQTATVTVAYNLVEDRDDEYSIVRVNDAYIGLDVWTDPLLEAATVEVVTPSGFVNSNQDQSGLASGQFQAVAEGEEIRFVASELDPEEYWTVLSLNRPERLVQRDLEIAGNAVTLRSWPGDTAWADEAAESIEEGLPILVDSVGLPWPLSNTLTVTESFDPTLAGYGGWYDRSDQEISVGDTLDDHLMMHELSHVWFGDRLFVERWITEGLANTYAALAVEAMDNNTDRPEPERVSLLDAEAIPLREWNSYFREPETEEWAYPASWTVTDAILTDVGKDVLDDVLEAAFNEEMSYPGDADAPEGDDGFGDKLTTSVAVDNWRRYLDLLENKSGEVVDDELQELFLDWVLVPADSRTLEIRNELRRRYFELVDDGGTWAPPYGLRDMMSRWIFPLSEQQLDAAEDAIERRDALAATVAPLGAELPVMLEEAYESGEGPDLMEPTNALFDEVEVAATQLVETSEALTSATGLFEQIGALGTDHRSELDEAVDAFSGGDLDAVADRTGDLDTAIDDLGRVGMIRAGSAAGGLVLVGLAGWLLVRRRGRNDRRVTDPMPRSVDSP